MGDGVHKKYDEQQGQGINCYFSAYVIYGWALNTGEELLKLVLTYVFLELSECVFRSAKALKQST